MLTVPGQELTGAHEVCEVNENSPGCISHFSNPGLEMSNHSNSLTNGLIMIKVIIRPIKMIIPEAKIRFKVIKMIMFWG